MSLCLGMPLMCLTFVFFETTLDKIKNRNSNNHHRFSIISDISEITIPRRRKNGSSLNGLKRCKSILGNVCFISCSNTFEVESVTRGKFVTTWSL